MEEDKETLEEHSYLKGEDKVLMETMYNQEFEHRITREVTLECKKQSENITSMAAKIVHINQDSLKLRKLGLNKSSSCDHLAKINCLNENKKHDHVVFQKSKTFVRDFKDKKLEMEGIEYSEEYLTSDINPLLIINMIKQRYEFTKVTKASLKHLLYEGARLTQ